MSKDLLSEIVRLRTYAAKKPDGTKETYEETVTRCLDMHKRKFPFLSSQLDTAFAEVYAKRVVPSMRSMQFSGQPIEKTNERMYNCTALAITTFKDFADILYLLACGCGVGYSVQNRHVSQLPEVWEGAPNLMIIGDTKESWADSVLELLQNPQISFDYSLIRPNGYPLSSGGTSSGPECLITCHTKMREILLLAAGRRLTPIEVSDLVCHIATCIVSGGVRRSALICLFDANDTDMLEYKSGSWWVTNPQRGKANVSAVLHRKATEFNRKVNTILDKCYASNSGEPGLFLTNDYDMLTNPCVTGDTKILTKKGYIRIDTLVGIETTVWNGFEWSTVTPRVTGTDKKTYKVTLSDGKTLTCTENHKWALQKGYSKNGAISKVTTTELSVGDRLIKSFMPVIMEGEEPCVDAYTQGFYSGDGTNGESYMYVQSPKYMCIPRLKTTSIGDEDTEYRRIKVKVTVRPEKTFVPVLWNLASRLEWVAGLLDSDGCELIERGAQLESTDREFLRGLQELLSVCGVHSKVLPLAEKAFRKMPNGRGSHSPYLCQKAYRICIGATEMQQLKTLGLVCSRLPFNKCPNRNASQFVKVVSIEEANVEEKVYCFTEPLRNLGCFNGVVTGNCGEIALLDKQFCNLTEVNVARLHSLADLTKAVAAATLIGTVQAAYTDFSYVSPKFAENCIEEALLGVSFTGQAENWGLLSSENLEVVSRIALSHNAHYAELLGINPAARIGCVKPSGSTSALLGTTSGIHAAHAPYYLRRVRVAKSDPIARYLKTKAPELVEDDIFDNYSIVVTVPVNKSNAIQRNEETPIELLERMKHINLHWIHSTHRRGNNNHNVSLTVNYRPEEKVEITEWMQIYRDIYSGVSLLPHDGGTYQQLPFEEITKIQYEIWCLKVPENLDLSGINFESVVDERSSEAACSGGSCEIS